MVLSMRRILIIVFACVTFFSISSVANAQVPGIVTGVLVEYPECVGESCSFVQASCSWAAVTGVASYNYVITEVDTSTQIQTATVDTSTLRVVFPVTQEKTYKCDVFATNSSGQSGGIGTHSLLCSAEGLLEPTVTVAPTVGPTSTRIPTKPPIEAPGIFTNTVLILGGVTLIIIAGLALILL